MKKTCISKEFAEELYLYGIYEAGIVLILDK